MMHNICHTTWSNLELHRISIITVQQFKTIFSYYSNMDRFVSLLAAQVHVEAILLQSFKLEECIHSMSSNGRCGISGCWESALTAGLSPRAAAGAARVGLAIDPSTVMHHCTQGDIAAQFCQGSLEYFFFITPAVGRRKWLPWGLFFAFVFVCRWCQVKRKDI